MSRISGRPAGERGVVLYLFVAGLVAFVGFAALAVDLGMLYTAQTQLQRAVDGGALAGAGWLGHRPGDEAGTRAEAESYTEQHEAMGLTIDIDPQADVEIESDTLVRVQAHRTEARAAFGGSVTTMFARVLGIDDADVAVSAAAVVAPGSLVDGCLFPFMPPDAWREVDGTRSNEVIFYDFDDAPIYEDSLGDFYQAPPRACLGPSSPYCWPSYTGWGAKPEDQGRYFIARWGPHGNNTPASGWWYTLNIPPDGEQGGGASNVRDAILGDCEEDEDVTVEEGSTLYVQTGVAQGPITTALDQVVSSGGPSDSTSAVRCYNGETEFCGEPVAASSRGPRIRTVTFYRPQDHPGPGSSVPTTVGNFADIWLAGFCDAYTHLALCAGFDPQDQRRTFVVMYLGPTTGIAAGEGGGGPSAGVMALRLVE